MIFLAESLCNTSCAPICPERRPDFDSKTTKNVRLKITVKISVFTEKYITAYQLKSDYTFFISFLRSFHFLQMIRSLHCFLLYLEDFEDLFLESSGPDAAKTIDFYCTIKYSASHIRTWHSSMLMPLRNVFYICSL